VIAMDTKGVISVGVSAMWNEAECIRGWAKVMLHLCRRVVALIDPTTDDATEAILRSEFPRVEIEVQDRSLGDTDNFVKGPQGIFIPHANLDRWLHKNVEPGDWFCVMSPDERYWPTDFPVLAAELKHAREDLYDALQIYYTLHVVRGERFYFDLDDGYVAGNYRHRRILRMGDDFHILPANHAGMTPARRPYLSAVPLYHFGPAKRRREYGSYWRDQEYLARRPVKPLPVVLPELPATSPLFRDLIWHVDHEWADDWRDLAFFSEYIEIGEL